MKYRAVIAFDAYFETVADPDVIVNKLLDKLGDVPTNDLNLTWDNVTWAVMENE